eukprot:jgi/Bigna1/127907/aug1.5_g2615
MKRSSSVWGRRLCNLHFLGEMARGDGDWLALIPTSFFSGPKPTAWWGRNDDKGLLEGTYTYGYARYDHIKGDDSLGFTSKEAKANAGHKPGSAATTNGWPSADVLTRRLKRLIDVARKHWRKRLPSNKAGGGRAGGASATGSIEMKLTVPKFKRRVFPVMGDGDGKNAAEVAAAAAAAVRYLHKRRRKVSGRYWTSTERRAVTRAMMLHPLRVDPTGRLLTEKLRAAAGLPNLSDEVRKD